MNLTFTQKLPFALALSVIATSSAWAAGRIVNLEAVEKDVPYNGFIIRFKEGSTERADITSLKSAVTKTMDKLIKSKSVDASFSANLRRPFTFAHMRKLGNDAHLFKPSRKLARGEALATLQELANNPNVEFVEPNLVLQHQLTPNDPLYSQQWGYGPSGIRAEGAWDVTTGAGVTVAVLDTGITNHPDLNANVIPGYDFLSGTSQSNDGDGRDSDASDPGDACGASPSSWHGTHVAGTIGALTNNGVGVSGVAYGAKLMPVRVLGSCGGELADIADGIVWASGGTVSGVSTLAAANAAKVINMSLGARSPTCPQSFADAISGATARGTTVVVAAGNSNEDASNHTPTNCAGVITVAAVDSNGNRASFSNYGTKVDVAAPGVGILSTINTGTTTPVAPDYKSYNGTSMATPHVAGVVALIQSRRLAASLPLFTPEQARNVVRAATRPLPNGCIEGCGTGIVDASAAMSLALTSSSPIGQQFDASGKITVTLFERKATAAASKFTDFAIDVPQDYVVIGGGVQGAGTPGAQLITASYPNSGRSAWLVSTKEHLQSGSTAITGWAVGLKVAGLTRAQLLSYMSYRMTSSTTSQNPTVSSTAMAGYTQIGGGFQVVTSGTGNLVWASYPTTANGSAAWVASAKEHGATSTASIRTYSIGLRTNLPGVGTVTASTVTSATSASVAKPAASVSSNAGYALTGCGAYVNWAGGYGNLLWQVQPTMSTTSASCTAQSTEHIYSSPATINTYAVGIKVN